MPVVLGCALLAHTDHAYIQEMIDGLYFVREPDGTVRPAKDTFELAKALENNSVKKTQLGGVLISTIFLGINHNFSRNGPPVLWETMIFGGERDQYQQRYTSEADALADHNRIVSELHHTDFHADMMAHLRIKELTEIEIGFNMDHEEDH